MENIIYDYCNRNDVIVDGMHKALDYVYSVSYPKYHKSFMEICKELNEERIKENGNSNWRKTYCDGKYYWPTDFFYIPKDVLNEIWNSYKEGYKAENHWRSDIEFLNKCLFEEPGFKEVYSPTEWSDGKDVKHCENQPLLKEVIGEDAANKVKELLEDYMYTYKFGSMDEMSFCGAYLSTPTTSRELVTKAWKESFDKDIDLPDDSYWKDKYYEEDDDE